MITRTIGATGQHVDVAAWVSYVQANQVLAGLLLDDQTGAIIAAGLSVSTPQIISGWAPGPGGYSTTLSFDPASSNAAWFGQNCRTNALFYNTARGAFITSSYSSGGGGVGGVQWRVDKNRTIGLMIKSTGGYNAAISWDTTAQTDILCEGNFIWATSDTSGAAHMDSAVDGTSVILRNNVFVSERGAGGSSGFLSDGNSTFANRVRLYDNVFYVDAAAVACRMGSGTYVEAIGNVFFPRVGNCGLSARDGQTNGSNNATNQSSWNNTGYGAGTITGIGSGQQMSINPANEFVGVTTSAMATDFRLKSGGTQLQGTNIVISGVTTDITGVTRTNPTDIGAYQFSAGATSYTLAANPGSYSITGAAAKLAATRALALNAGSYAITGFAARLARAFMLAANPGSYAITGIAAKLVATRVLAANPGSYAITGAAANLTYTTSGSTYTLPANPGSYLISGVATGLVAARKLAANPGSYAITGAAAKLTATRALAANAGVYTITGQAALLRATRVLVLGPGAYAITGLPARLGADRKLSANAGSYFVTGAAASLTKINAYILQADPGSYFITGRGADLSWSGASQNASDYIIWARRKERR